MITRVASHLNGRVFECLTKAKQGQHASLIKEVRLKPTTFFLSRNNAQSRTTICPDYVGHQTHVLIHVNLSKKKKKTVKEKNYVIYESFVWRRVWGMGCFKKKHRFVILAGPITKAVLNDGCSSFHFVRFIMMDLYREIHYYGWGIIPFLLRALRK